jgi:hypothetical protein
METGMIDFLRITSLFYQLLFYLKYSFFCLKFSCLSLKLAERSSNFKLFYLLNL